MHILCELIKNKLFEVLIIFIILDTIFGILRAIKQKTLNSCIGIDGIIRKVGMMISILFLFLVDSILTIDLLCFIPENLKLILNIDNVGIGSLFCILFIIFEILSILKNMILCELPIPAKFKCYLEKIMKELTSEIKEGDNKK